MRQRPLYLYYTTRSGKVKPGRDFFWKGSENMPDPTYPIPEEPAYRVYTIRAIQDEDYVSATEVVNPLVEAVLESVEYLNQHKVELNGDGKVPPEQLPEMNYDQAGSAAAVREALTAHTNDRNNPHRVTAAQAGAVPASEKGQAGGVAQLDASGKVPESQLPALGGHTAQKTAPANTKLLWIDTSDGNILKFYNAATEAWEPVGAVWWR